MLRRGFPAGATPMLGMLREMAVVRRRQRELEVDTAELLAETAFPLKVSFHWACRGMAELALLDNAILQAYRLESSSPSLILP